jgi:Cu2+-exporting ATPase
VLASTPTSPVGEASEAVVLDVRGMKCGGCSAAVKRILLQQPRVQSAAVNLLTETAVVMVAAAQAQQGAAAAAQALSDKGFPASLRSLDDSGLAGDAAALSERKEQELRSSTRSLAFAWGLALVCCTHHLGHLLHSLGLHQYAHTGDAQPAQQPAASTHAEPGQLRCLHAWQLAAEAVAEAWRRSEQPCLCRPPLPDFMMALGNPWVSGVLGAAALLGPGRPLLVDGAVSLVR